MPPDMHENIPNDDEVSAEQHASWTAFIFPTFIIFAVLVFVAVYIYVTRPETEQLQTQDIASTTTEQLADSKQPENTHDEDFENVTFSPNKENISFVLPDGWESVPVDERVMPLGFASSTFLLHNRTFDCYVAGGFNFVRDIRNEYSYEQVSNATQVSSDELSFGGDWYFSTAFYPDLELEYTPERQPLDDEVRIATNHRTTDLALWVNAPTEVPLECELDFNQLLSTVEYSYEEVDLKEVSPGQLIIKRDWTSTRRTASSNTSELDTYRIVHIDENNVQRSVMEVPYGLGHGEKVFVSDGKFYGHVNRRALDNKYTLTSGALVEIDPFHKTLKTLLDLESEGQMVQDIYLHESKLYFLTRLAKENCDGFSASCNTQLFRFSIQDSATELLATSTRSARILGLDTDLTALYLSQGYGDAGCVSATFKKYNLETKELIELGDYSGCVSEEAPGARAGYEELQEMRDSIYAQLISKESSETVRVQGETLVPGNEEYDDSYTTFIFDTSI